MVILSLHPKFLMKPAPLNKLGSSGREKLLLSLPLRLYGSNQGSNENTLILCKPRHSIPPGTLWRWRVPDGRIKGRVNFSKSLTFAEPLYSLAVHQSAGTLTHSHGLAMWFLSGGLSLCEWLTSPNCCEVGGPESGTTLF